MVQCHRRNCAGVGEERQKLSLAPGPVGNGTGDRQQEYLQQNGQRDHVREERSGVDGDPEQVHEAANSGGALCHCSQVGAEKDRGDRRRERGVGPVVEVPAALLAAVASVISYTICGVRDTQWLLPRASLSPLGTL